MNLLKLKKKNLSGYIPNILVCGYVCMSLPILALNNYNMNADTFKQLLTG